MLQIKVVPQSELKGAFVRFSCHYAISIQDAIEVDCPTPTPQGILRERHAHYFFDDIRFEGTTHESSHARGVLRDFPPREKDIVDLLDFVSRIPDGERLLIHCWAGRSRSTACAIAIHISRGLSIKEAFEEVQGIRTYPDFIPNQLILKYADKLLNQGGKLIEFVNSWYLDQDNLREQHFVNVNKILNGGSL